MGTICDPPRIYPSLSEYTPFSMSTICDPPTIYPSLPEYTPLFNNYMRPSQNLLIPPRIYPHFQQLQDYATLPESAPPSYYIFQFWEQVVDSLTITKASRKGGIFSD